MIKTIIIVLILLMFLFHLLLDFLNYNYRNKPLPDNVKHIYDQEKYQTWKNYTMDNLKLSMIKSSITMMVFIGFLVFNVFGLLESWSNLVFDSVILENLFFLLIYLLITTLISLPFKYISVFKIEEKYGFNKSTKKTFTIDQIKSLLMFICFGGGIIALIHVIYLNFSNLWLFILLAWLAISFIMLILFALNTKVLIKIFNKLTPLEESELKTKIEELAKEVGFKVDSIYIMDASRRSTKLNAFFSGIGKTKTVVLFDTLVDKMEPNEICAVLAHELGHAVHKDISRMLLEQLMMLGVFAAIFGFIMQFEILFTSFGLSGLHLGFGLILFMILIEPMSLLIGILTNHLSRKAEYRADLFACRYTSSTDMKDALIKLFRENLSNLNPHPLYVKFYYSHPEAHKRLKNIENQK